MKTLRNITLGLALLLTLLVGARLYADSKNGTGSTETVLVFGPQQNPRDVTAVDATSDKLLSKVTVRGRTASAAPYKVNGSGTTSQAVVPLNQTTGLSSNDYVVVHGPYAPYRGRLIAVTSSNVTLDANLTSACDSGDRVYKLTTLYTIPVGSNSVNRAGTPLVQTSSDSPVVLQLDSTAAGELSATVK